MSLLIIINDNFSRRDYFDNHESRYYNACIKNDVIVTRNQIKY